MKVLIELEIKSSRYAVAQDHLVRDITKILKALTSILDSTWHPSSMKITTTEKEVPDESK